MSRPQILDTWLSGTLLPRTGSGELQALLDVSLRHLEAVGITIPSDCRQKRALSLLRRINNGQVLLRPDDSILLHRIETNWRTAWETVLISHAIYNRRRQRSRTPFTNDRLRRMMGGHELGDTPSSAYARDVQFELFVAALFAHTAVDVQGGEPDLRVTLGYERIGIAAKRVRSLKPARIAEHVNRAVVQIRDTGLRGMIALNLDARLEGANLPAAAEERGNLFVERLDIVLNHIKPCVDDPNILGIIVFAQCARWVFPAGDESHIPILDAAMPVRWLTWDDNPSMRLLLDDYQRAWRSAVERNVADIIESARRFARGDDR
ncbi:MAG TPA: hypothetical protein VFA43_00485 [Gemmatimonadaceae bacterium]|nr:hypothetical protein [Gemmatimonadaceae bacterium]